MYKIEIKTIYNEITLHVKDYKTPEIKEILSQPYILKVKIEKEKDNER